MAISTAIGRLSLLGALAVAGCSGRDDPLGLGGRCGVLGTSSVNVTGAVAPAVDGCAIFSITPAEGETPAVFGLSLTAGSATTASHTVAIVRTGPRPVAGTYNVGSGAGDIRGGFTFEASTQRAFELTSGSLTITQSSASALVGSVSLIGTESTAGGATVNITGTFSARCIDPGPATDC